MGWMVGSEVLPTPMGGTLGLARGLDGSCMGVSTTAPAVWEVLCLGLSWLISRGWAGEGKG